MKFYCDSCNTKYGIADEKVRGKVLKVRCKKCGNVITVREQTVPSQRASGSRPPAPSQPTSDPRQVQWHYSINGQSFGPFAFGVLAQRFASGELGDECYVWTESFSSWKPVRAVEAFKAAVQKGQRIKPRRKTLGVSQALKAVKPEDFKRRQAEKAAQKEPKQRDEQKPKESPKASERPEETSTTQEDDGQKDRLKKLRARLKSSAGSSSSTPKPDKDESDDKAPISDLAADGGSAQGLAASNDEAQEKPADPFADDASDALGPTLPMGGGSEPQPAGDWQVPDDEKASENSGLFADFDEPAASSTATPEAQASSQEDSAPEDSDHIPFFPEGPELGSESGKVAAKKKKDEPEGITGSLLIQLDNIQKQGRGKKVLLAVGALLIVGGLTATAIYLASQVEPEKKVVKKDSAKPEEDDELVIRTYSNDEQNKIMMLGSQNVGKDEGKAGSQAGAKDEAPTKVAVNRKSSASKKQVRGPKSGKDEPSIDDAFKSAKKRGAGDDSFRKKLDDGAVAKTKLDSPIAGKSDAFNSLTALSAGERDDPIYKPTDTLKEREKKANSGSGMTLTRKQISQGISTVRRSVGICRQRHSRRGAALEARKIYLTLTVQPTGRVSAFTLEPERIRHTEFEKCMNSHRGRWKFPSFSGSAQKMRAPFVLQ